MSARVRFRWDRSKGSPEPIAALNRVREKDNGEPLVALAEVAPSVRLPHARTIPFVRQTVAEMAERAARSLPTGTYLAITDAWRPIERQKMIYEWFTQCVIEAYPGLNYAQLKRKVNRFVAPYDQKAPPGHCTGAAIDVNLVDENNEPLDVTSPYERFSAAPTYTLGLSATAQRNRDLLLTTMLGVGFSNCRDEWWHYSWGDAGWAVRVGEPECVYGLFELPREVFEEQQRLWVEAFDQRSNPFITGDPNKPKA